jgi:FkbM family methyltransferase
MINHYLISYAQNREDIILNGFFGEEEKGFYVDIGGFDPDLDSVTKFFYQRGWHGINVEPQPDKLQLFEKKRPRDINILKGVSDQETSLKLRSYKNQGLSTFSPKMKTEYKTTQANDQVREYEDIEVEVTTLKNLFTDCHVKSIQFMKVDVEGLEYEVLAGNDWEKYRPEVICIEANHILKDWRMLLAKNGYNLVFFDGLNEYYTDTRTMRSKKFDYVEAVVFKEPIVHSKLAEEFDRYDEVVNWLEDEVKRLSAEQNRSQEQNHRLQVALQEITPLRRHIMKSGIHYVRLADKKAREKLEKKPTFLARPIDSSQLNKSKKVEQMIAIALQSDHDNFEIYNECPSPSKLLPAYNTAKRLTKKTISKLRKKKSEY